MNNRYSRTLFFDLFEMHMLQDALQHMSLHALMCQKPEATASCTDLADKLKLMISLEEGSFKLLGEHFASRDIVTIGKALKKCHKLVIRWEPHKWNPKKYAPGKYYITFYTPDGPITVVSNNSVQFNKGFTVEKALRAALRDLAPDDIEVVIQEWNHEQCSQEFR